MSASPPLRRLSSASTSSKESLINAYEAEEERIINVLSRKLEKLREEKIELENALEAESESHVNRLSREISALRLAQQQAVNGSGTLSPVETRMPAALAADPLQPSTEMVLDAMRRENEQLRNRLIETERDYIRLTRLNEIYREELIEHRRKAGLPVDDLIGLAPSTVDPLSQPLHRRPSISSWASPNYTPQSPVIHSARVPIPRLPSQVHRPSHATISPSTTPPSSSSASLSSLPMFSPTAGQSSATSATTPGSLGSFTGRPATLVPRAMELTYPSVPPPSVASSFGEPPSIGSPVRSLTLDTITEPVAIPRAAQQQRHERDVSSGALADSFSTTSPRRPSLSPRASMYLARRPSADRVPWTGDGSGLGSPVRTRSRMASLERGARVAETGTLVPRTRRENLVGGAHADTALGGTSEQTSTVAVGST
ncbi:uncharacterized protein PHACADRAFT_194053 [Phanerochaete carnosa HHB-10118-sp]|uniref:Uncharacterized protein n=1 Tax=Phanerochaete carnosa (strain HHB-10118-sp) TaxID=650164 RepID=K5WB66_PHACS|nr:uncharacterized protein PHACADRAFT_194053 [Phanerochaete carnosa HHB-10118-sp]EKM56440.1 hypothetical protein PHACADRAFT_194053 [Phanerochaete carnosa HHB-10118-sp]